MGPRRVFKLFIFQWILFFFSPSNCLFAAAAAPVRVWNSSDLAGLACATVPDPGRCEVWQTTAVQDASGGGLWAQPVVAVKTNWAADVFVLPLRAADALDDPLAPMMATVRIESTGPSFPRNFLPFSESGKDVEVILSDTVTEWVVRMSGLHPPMSWHRPAGSTLQGPFRSCAGGQANEKDNYKSCGGDRRSGAGMHFEFVFPAAGNGPVFLASGTPFIYHINAQVLPDSPRPRLDRPWTLTVRVLGHRPDSGDNPYRYFYAIRSQARK